MKKLAKYLIITVCIVSIILVGCQPEYSSKKINYISPNKQEITVWYHFNGSNINQRLKELADMFNDANPNYHVKMELVSDISTMGTLDKLIYAVNGGVPPDVVIVDRYLIGSAIEKGAFQDLTNLATKDNITKDMFYEFAWNDSTYNEKLYAIPFDTDVRLLYYNKQLFNEAGLNPNSPPTSIRELEEYAAKLTKQEHGEYIQMGFIPWMNEGYLYTWGWAFGGQYYDQQSERVTVNHDKIIDALQWLGYYSNQYDFEKIMYFLTREDYGIDAFAEERCAMMIGGSGKIAEYAQYYPELDYGVALIPTVENSDFITWSGGFGLAIPKGVEHKEAAFEFIKFMSIGEGATFFVDKTSHFVCSKKINTESKLIKDNGNYKFAVELLDKAYSRPPIIEGKMLWEELIYATTKVLNKQAIPNEILNEINNKINNSIDDNGNRWQNE